MGKIVRRADRRRNFETLRSILFIALIVSLTSILFVRADNPSPVGWNLSGGGFCGGSYTIFNTTLAPNPGLYAQNCQTGANDFFNATDVGFLFNKVRSSLSQGGTIEMRSGIYAAVTSLVFSTTVSSFFACGLTLEGSTGMGTTIGTAVPLRGTVIIAKTNGMTVIKSTTTPSTGSPSLIGCQIRNITIILTGVTGSVIGIDFRMTETRTDNKFVNIGVDCQDSGCGTSGIGLYLDGNEDTQVVDYNGGGFFGTGGTSVDIRWNSPLGNVIIEDSAFTLASVGAQNVVIAGTTISQLNILSATDVISLMDDYMLNFPPPVGGRINVNAQTLGAFIVTGSVIGISSSVPLFVNTGTISNSAFASNSWYFYASSNWNFNAATLTKQNTNGGNHVHSGSAPTNFPFTIDGNGNF